LSQAPSAERPITTRSGPANGRQRSRRCAIMRPVKITLT
jgi:hypothetical protein